MFLTKCNHVQFSPLSFKEASALMAKTATRKPRSYLLTATFCEISPAGCDGLYVGRGLEVIEWKEQEQLWKKYQCRVLKRGII